MLNARCLVYTTLFGGYEDLNEQPVTKMSSIDFICLTDDPNLISDTWSVEYVAPLFKNDPLRNARYAKIMAHKFFPDYDVSLYIDNSILLKEIPEKIFRNLLVGKPYPLSCFIHPWRDNFLDEAQEVIGLGYESASRVHEQVNHLMVSHSRIKDQLNDRLLQINEILSSTSWKFLAKARALLQKSKYLSNLARYIAHKITS